MLIFYLKLKQFDYLTRTELSYFQKAGSDLKGDIKPASLDGWV